MAATSQAAPGTPEPLIGGVFRTLVPAPAFAALARFTYQPGAFFPPSAGQGPVIFRVVDGTLEFSAEDTVTKLAVGSEQPEDLSAGRTFTVTAGDQLIVPGGVVHTARTVGEVPARTLGLAVFAAAPPQEFPDGISFEPLALGPVERLPDPPAASVVSRVRLAAGTVRELARADGPQLLHVESGQVRVELRDGSASTWQGGVSGTLTPGRQTELSPAGGGVLVQAGAAVAVHAGSAAVLLAAAVTGGGPSDPETAGNWQLVRRYVAEVIDGHEPDRAAQYVGENAVYHDRPAEQQGLAGITGALRSTFDAFADLSTAIDATIAEGDLVLSRWTRTGVSVGQFRGVPPTRRPVRYFGLTIHRIRAGKIVEEWEAWDVTDLMTQLDATMLGSGLDAEPPMQREAVAKTCASRFIYDLWSGGDLAVVDDLLAADFTNHTPLPGQLPGADGIRQFVTRWRSAFPDLSVTIDLLVAESDQVAVRWTSRGRHRGVIFGLPPSGRYLTVSGITVFAVHGGRIAEAWQQVQLVDFLEQLEAAEAAPAATGPEGGDLR